MKDSNGTSLPGKQAMYINQDPSTQTEKSKTQLTQVLVHSYTKNCYHHQNTIAINVNGLFILLSLTNYATIVVVELTLVVHYASLKDCTVPAHLKFQHQVNKRRVSTTIYSDT